MAPLNFYVDRELNLLGGNVAFEEIVGTFAGRDRFPYYDVVPPICFEGRDAVATALERGRTMHLEGYRFGCLHGSAVSNVLIAPHGNPPEGAWVTLEMQGGCEVAERLRRSEHLIDIGKTSSALAHGIRNPLNAIKGAVVYLKEKYAEETTLQDFSQIIEEEISRLDCFITDFLRNSLIAPSSLEVDVNTLLRKIEMVTALQAEACNVTMRFRCGEVPAVTVNPYEFEQAVLNVLNNALHALAPGGAIAVDSSVVVSGKRRFVQVRIADTGPGLSDETIGSCSAPLEGRAKSRGKGFGLFLTREVMQHHRGEFEITSRHGKGTTALLRLPVDGIPSVN